MVEFIYHPRQGLHQSFKVVHQSTVESINYLISSINPSCVFVTRKFPSLWSYGWRCFFPFSFPMLLIFFPIRNVSQTAAGYSSVIFQLSLREHGTQSSSAQSAMHSNRAAQQQHSSSAAAQKRRIPPTGCHASHIRQFASRVGYHCCSSVRRERIERLRRT